MTHIHLQRLRELRSAVRQRRQKESAHDRAVRIDGGPNRIG
jgi:hypothetical protein